MLSIVAKSRGLMFCFSKPKFQPVWSMRIGDGVTLHVQVPKKRTETHASR